MTLYDLLDVPRDADGPALRAAWERARARAPRSGVRLLLARLAGVSVESFDEAYAVLSDPRQRAEYDHRIAAIEYAGIWPASL